VPAHGRLTAVLKRAFSAARCRVGGKLALHLGQPLLEESEPRRQRDEQLEGHLREGLEDVEEVGGDAEEILTTLEGEIEEITGESVE